MDHRPPPTPGALADVGARASLATRLLGPTQRFFSTAAAGGVVSLIAGVIAGSVIGKPLGILLASYAVVRLNVAELPTDVSWRQLHGAAWLAGIGFTMSIFSAGLAFPDAAAPGIAKRGIILSAALAGVVGFLPIRRERAVTA